MRIEERVVIRASPDRVWSILTAWEAQASWMPDVARVRVLGGERELGARIAVRTKVLGIPLVTDELRVTAWEPPRRLAIEHRGLVRGVGEWRLEPADGGTRFIWQETLLMLPPILGALALWVYRPVQRAMLRRSIRNLSRLARD